MNLALVLVLLAGAPGERVRDSGPRVRGRESWTPAFFEAFPANGRGTFGACSTTPPTGAKGETLTFTRTGNATCTKTTSGGLATTGIANGDLVVMSANQPRVEYDSAGTLGLLVEAARTNSALRSQEFNNAAWVPYGVGAVAAVVNATDSAVAPDGTTTAETVTFAATTAGQASALYVSIGVLATANASTVFARTSSGSCTFDVCEEYNGASFNACSTITAVSGSWTRSDTSVSPSTAGTNRYLLIGNLTARNGGTARAACTVYLWGAQLEAGSYATSYIPTTSAAVTRNAELARAVLPTSIPAGSTYCIAASGWIPGVTANATLMSVEDTWGTANPPLLAANDATSNARCYGAFGGNLNTGAAYATGQHRLRCTSERVAVWDSTSAAGASTTLSGTSANVGIGAPGNSTTQCNCIVSRVQLDPSPTRCR